MVKEFKLKIKPIKLKVPKDELKTKVKEKATDLGKLIMAPIAVGVGLGVGLAAIDMMGDL